MECMSMMHEIFFEDSLMADPRLLMDPVPARYTNKIVVHFKEYIDTTFEIHALLKN